MDKINLYMQLSKAVDLTNSSEKITESIEGHTRTKYKLKGVASTTSLDRDNEKISPTCIRKMAESIKTKRLPIFGNHEHHWENMLGYANTAEVQGENLIIGFETAYEETHPKVKQLIGSLQAGLPLMLSIGGKVKMGGKHDNIVEDVDLLETSVVGIGANPDAFISLDDVAKAFKGDDKMDTEIIKSSGQTGETSYGKLGETTPQARCPKCGKPAELREQEGDETEYHCHSCGIEFEVRAETKDTAPAPTNNPSSPKTPKIGDEPKLVIEGKAAEDLDLKKGDSMAEIAKEAKKEAEAEARCKEADAEYEAYKAKKKKEAEFEARMKAEGIDTVPGGENAAPKNSLKSVKEYESMQKAFVDNVATEGISKSVEEDSVFSFKSFRDEQVRRK